MIQMYNLYGALLCINIQVRPADCCISSTHVATQVFIYPEENSVFILKTLHAFPGNGITLALSSPNQNYSNLRLQDQCEKRVATFKPHRKTNV